MSDSDLAITTYHCSRCGEQIWLQNADYDHAGGMVETVRCDRCALRWRVRYQAVAVELLPD